MAQKNDIDFKNFIECSSLPMALLNSQWSAISLNKEFTDFCGYTLSDVFPLDKWWETAYPDDNYRNEVISSWESIVEDSGFVNGKLQPLGRSVTCKDGSVKEVELHFSKVENDHILLIFNDVTKSKITEKMHLEVKKEKETAQHYLDIVDVMIIASDANIRVTLINRKGCEVLGYSENELLGINGFELCVPEKYRPIYVDYFTKVITGSIGEISNVELPIITKNGNERLIKWQVTPLKENGEITGVLTSGSDITESKLAEKALLLDESRLEALVELNHMDDFSIYDVIHFALEKAVELTCSEIGYIGFVNEDESVISIHSWSENALERCSITDYPTDYPVEDVGLWGEPVRKRKAIIMNGTYDNWFLQKKCPEGHIPIRSHLGVPTLEAGKVISIVGVGNKEESYDNSDIRQITLLMEGLWKIIKKRQDEGRLRKYAEELARKNSELESLDLLKDEFLSNITHELKTPLISIKGYSDLLSEGQLGPLNESQIKGLNSIIKGSERLQRLVDSILCLQDVYSGNVEYDADVICLKDLIEKVLYGMNLTIDGRSSSIELDMPEYLPLFSGNYVYIEQVFYHILDNALKFTSKSDTIRISAEVEAKDIHVIVGDSGIGISKEKLPHIFTRFYQADGSLSRRYGGNGIGLHLCKSIIEAHGGKIWAESEEGTGTKIHIKLPFVNKV